MRWHGAAFPDRWLYSRGLLTSLHPFLQSCLCQLHRLVADGLSYLICYYYHTTASSSWHNAAPLQVGLQLFDIVLLTRTNYPTIPAYCTCGRVPLSIRSFFSNSHTAGNLLSFTPSLLHPAPCVCIHLHPTLLLPGSV